MVCEVHFRFYLLHATSSISPCSCRQNGFRVPRQVRRPHLAPYQSRPLLTTSPRETRDRIRTTHKTYDNFKLEKIAKDQATIGAVTLFIHYQWGYLLILLLHAVLSASTIVQVPLFKIWILGKKPEGVVKRPWKGDAAEKVVKLR